MARFIDSDWRAASSGCNGRIFAQLLYTIKMPKGFDVIGCAVNVYNTTGGYNRGVALDVALRIPVPVEFTPTFVRYIKFSIGAFRGVNGTKWNPTYSVDFRF